MAKTDNTEKKHVALFSLPLLLLGLVCTALVWVFFLFQIHVFVPYFSAPVRWFWAAYGATCLSGVFFLAFHMLAAVILDPRKDEKVR